MRWGSVITDNGKREDDSARRLFGAISDAGAAAYCRARDLPKLLALWPHELEDESEAGRVAILRRLEKALRAERRRALAGHWAYDLNRHLALIAAYKAERRSLTGGQEPLGSGPAALSGNPASKPARPPKRPAPGAKPLASRRRPPDRAPARRSKE